jgi:long-chain acyl-CoA synthetase
MIETLPEMLLHTIEAYPKDDLMLYKQEGTYVPLSTAEFGKRVRLFSLGLHRLGVEAGDKVVILSENRPEWVMVDFAALCLGGITVPIYTTLSAEQIRHIIENSDAGVVVCSDRELWHKVDAVREKLPEAKHFILFEPDPPGDVLSMQEVWDLGEKEEQENPGGVMLTHKNLISNAEAVLSVIDISQADTVLSFLPLSHIFERWATCCYLYVGVTIGYAESIDTLSDNMLEIRPTAMVTVPRLLEKIYARVMDNVLSGSGLKRAIFYWALGVGRIYARKKVRKETVPGFLAFKRKIANSLVFAKIYARTGGRLRFFVSAGAPLAKELGEAFYALGLLAIEGYGLTETSPVITCNRPEDLKFGSVGKPIPGVEVKIAEDGEILARGPNIMKGYYKMEEATREAFEGDWFRTGDVGHVDEEGFLVITDRKKDILVTSGGKNVAPQPIENLLKSTSYIMNAVVLGDGRRFVSALIVPDFDKLESYARKKGIAFQDRKELVRNEAILALIQQEVDKSQVNLSRFEKIKKIALLDREFDQESGEITPSLKVKRDIIEQKYRQLIDSLYEEGERGDSDRSKPS